MCKALLNRTEMCAVQNLLPLTDQVYGAKQDTLHRKSRTLLLLLQYCLACTVRCYSESDAVCLLLCSMQLVHRFRLQYYLFAPKCATFKVTQFPQVQLANSLSFCASDRTLWFHLLSLCVHFYFRNLFHSTVCVCLCCFVRRPIATDKKTFSVFTLEIGSFGWIVFSARVDIATKEVSRFFGWLSNALVQPCICTYTTCLHAAVF